MRIRLTNFAKIQIRTIYSYHKEAASLQLAQKIKNEIDETILKLVGFPESGQVEEAMVHFGKMHRRLIAGNYKIIYFIDGDQLFISDVFDTRQNPVKMNP